MIERDELQALAADIAPKLLAVEAIIGRRMQAAMHLRPAKAFTVNLTEMAVVEESGSLDDPRLDEPSLPNAMLEHDDLEHFMEAVLSWLSDLAERYAGYEKTIADDPMWEVTARSVRRRSDGSLRTVQELLNPELRLEIPGILGSFRGSQFREWFEQGYTSLEELAEKAAEYSHHIRGLGLRREVEIEFPFTTAAEFGRWLEDRLQAGRARAEGRIPDDDPVAQAQRLGREVAEAIQAAGKAEASHRFVELLKRTDVRMGPSAKSLRALGFALPLTPLDYAQIAWMWHDQYGDELLDHIAPDEPSTTGARQWWRQVEARLPFSDTQWITLSGRPEANDSDRNKDYVRIIPRDLFNEGNLFKCLGQLYLNLEKLGMEECLQHDGGPFEVEQLESSGATSAANVVLVLQDVEYRPWRPLNSRRPYPLYIDDADAQIEVFTDQGAFTDEMLRFLDAHRR